MERYRHCKRQIFILSLFHLCSNDASSPVRIWIGKFIHSRRISMTMTTTRNSSGSIQSIHHEHCSRISGIHGGPGQIHSSQVVDRRESWWHGRKSRSWEDRARAQKSRLEKILPYGGIFSQYLIRKYMIFGYYISILSLNALNLFSTLSIPSPLGDLIAVANETHLLLLEFADSKGLEKNVSVIARSHGDVAIQSEKNRILLQTQKELREYFSWTRRSFSLPLVPAGTEFQKKAWEALSRIPYGETRSYKEEAILAWNPKAVRAIGGANNKNPIVIIIPCHRVIGKNGKLVGYGGGIERKIWLLEHESKTWI